MLKVTQYIAFYPVCYIILLPQMSEGHGYVWKDQFDDFIYSANHYLNKLYSHEHVRNIQFMLLHPSCNFTL